MLEIACFDITSAEIALQSVADRIELCSEINVGGLTPNFEEFRYLNEKYDKQIHVMIRPSGGSFLYSEQEFQQMKNDVQNFSRIGADGFVFGILNENREIDIEKNRILIELAEGKPCVFHRAIDRTPDVFKSVETLIDLGFKEILTSGGKATAAEGSENLKKMIADYSSKIKILIGGGVRSSNVKELEEITKGTDFHSSAILSYEIFTNPEEIKKLKELSS